MKRRMIVIAVAVLLLGSAAWGGSVWYGSRSSVSTDDAYVEGTVAPVSAKIPGQVSEVLVRDNESVKAGQVIARLDARDYRARLEQAKAAVTIAERRHQAAAARVGLGREMVASQLAQARAASMGADAAKSSAVNMVESTRAIAQSRQAALASAMADRDRAAALNDRAIADLRRAREMFEKELVAKQVVEYAETDGRAAAAQLVSAEERVSQARRDLESAQADARLREAGFEPQQIGLRTADARVEQAKAQHIQAEAMIQEVRVREAERDLAQAQLKEAEVMLGLAQLNLDDTAIRAPVTGMVSKKSVEVGQVVQPGQPLLAIVPLNDVWVLANFKETQLRRVRPGMRVEVVVEGDPDHPYTGKVDSISAGTGSRFSLLPPENATGNWVKVVQRVPVKIVLEPQATSDVHHSLRAGMSAFVTIRLR
ncbi:MAG TPA: HlyD family secretion protein [Candidatus Acidoferrum sp.]|nr:HlyD family secretion protein [Candidatus Acidoferrum sp.]